MLRIASNLKLPDEAVTQTFAILAKRGVGKTYTASVMVEEMLKNNLPVVVIDPIGVWWGLRSSADGKKAGLSIVIAGGDHADIPLTPDNGETMADLIIDQQLSVVIDLSLFRKGEQVKFMTAFAETMYRKNRVARHIVIDEADAFAPQRPMPGEQRMLGAIEDIVRRGRARGLGVTMITQRPAVLNKNVLTQIEVLVALRLTAPIDQKAIDEWVKTHAEEGQRELLMGSLPSLPVGTAWFWSPGWLDIFKKVKVRTRETLDSSSTPKVGKVKVQPRKMADVDLEKIRERLSDTIAKAEADNPQALKQKIKELEKRNEILEHVAKKKEPEQIITQVEVLPKDFKHQLKLALDVAESAAIQVQKLIDIANKYSEASDTVSQFNDHPKSSFAQPDANRKSEVAESPKQPQMQMNDGKLGPGEFKILAAAGQHPAGITRTHMTILTGYKRSSRNTYISRLTAQGLVEVANDTIKITQAGIDKLGDRYDPLPTGKALRDRLLSELPPGEKKILEVLLYAYPAAKTRDELTDQTGYQRSSRNTYLSRMSAREIVEVNGQEVKASEVLFA